MASKSLSLVQIVLLNAVVCGIEICACAGFTYVPPMLLKAGYTEENMSIILGLGPLLAFFLVPIIGRASDSCKSHYGRRRPFILGISLLLAVSLIIVPYGDVISLWFVGPGSWSKSVTVGMLTIGVVMLDFTSQACLTPCEALLSDASKDTDQHEKVFTVYSQMISLGGFIGYLVTALDWNSTVYGSFIGGQEKSVFSMLVVILMLLLCATLMVAEEAPLATEETNEIEESPFLQKQNINDLLLAHNSANTLESGYESSASDNDSSDGLMRSNTRRNKHFTKFLSKSYRTTPLRCLCYPVSCVLKRFKFVTILQNLCRYFFSAIYDKLPESIKNLFDVPIVLQKLALANFFSWTAVMGFNLFFTDFVGQAVYEGSPNAEENSYLRMRYDEGVRMGSWGLLFHCITSTVYAMFIERLVEKYGSKRTYLCGMIVFTISMLGMVMYRHVVFVSIMAALTGFAYATLTTIPFILITKYHSEKEVFFSDCSSSSKPVSQQRGMATDMATLDSAYFLSQVVLSALMGYVVHVTGTVLSYIVVAGVMGLLSCFFIRQIVVCPEDLKPRTRHHRHHQNRTLHL
ncbi:hypothetical protein FSP39_004984 [Pinctada imbricata]|uniref:Solute carrier family 45 member 3 n=1 Tax=Pinctada imbricata TaxID=66713 RepID=A0AA89C0T4_PINIB|nr:hypothetical protein FSP39_004984 [Pinctada imbricata]